VNKLNSSLPGPFQTFSSDVPVQYPADKQRGV